MWFGPAFYDGQVCFGIQFPGAYLETGWFDPAILFDGKAHRVSLTWDSDGGAWQIYVDGSCIFSGAGLRSGHSLRGDGTFVVGMDSDGGTSPFWWGARTALEAAVYDVRLFSDVRTASEIAQFANSEVDPSEQGLIASWRMDELTAGVVASSVGGHDLMITHATGPGWVASTPSVVMGVRENIDGAVVGTLAAADPDAGDVHSFTVSDARFEVVGGSLKLKSGMSLDHEAEPVVALTVTASDASGLSRSEVFTIRVLDQQMLVNGTSLEDALTGGALEETFYAGEGDDVVEGGAGDDILEGGAGADTLLGGIGNDTVKADDGHDLVVELDAGTIDAGAGDDVVVRLSGAGRTVISLGTGTDTLVLDSIEGGGSGNAALDFTISLSDFNGSGGDRIDLSNLRDSLGNVLNMQDIAQAVSVAGGQVIIDLNGFSTVEGRHVSGEILFSSLNDTSMLAAEHFIFSGGMNWRAQVPAGVEFTG
jgi:Ca2+-binding RTX toxin-like protein